jgi:hypothetical protein
MTRDMPKDQELEGTGDREQLVRVILYSVRRGTRADRHLSLKTGQRSRLTE